MPAWSADRQWWFNGQRWIRAAPFKTFPRPQALEWVMAAGWLLLWVLGVVWCGIVTQTPPGHTISEQLAIVGIALGASALVWLSVCSFTLGLNRRWTYVWVLICYLEALLLNFFVVAMFMTPSDAAGDDTGAGVGLIIISVPMVCMVAVFVGIGAGVSLLVDRLGRRRTSCPTV